jgi:dihydroneopterin aldolase
VAEIIINEFHVPWLKLTLNKLGAIRGARGVGIVIERGNMP